VRGHQVAQTEQFIPDITGLAKEVVHINSV